MSKTICVSLPVTNLAASTAFYEALGFSIDPRFTDGTAARLDWSDHIGFMLVTREKWQTFTKRPIPPSTSSEVMLSMSCDSRAAVDAMAAAAAEHGGSVDINPVEDHGFMYCRDLTDPDGHALGALWLDMARFPKQ